jgi:hypothetical protein
MSEPLAELHRSLNRGFAKALGGDPEAPGPEIAAYVDKGHGPLPGTCKLLAWDANSIKSFVFGTTNAAAIRGASHLLKKLDENLREGVLLGLDRDQILFAGGGSGLAVVSPEQAGAAIEKLHRLFAERTLISTCCATSVDLGTGDQEFRDLREATQNEIARERVLRGSDVEAATPFFAERCRVCGQRAALAEAKNRIGGPRLECEVCSHAIESGKKDRHDQQETPDFEAIADERRGGFLAVVYADGNGIGKRISLLPSPLAFKTFSRAIDDVLSLSFSELIERYGLTEHGAATAGRRGYAYQQPICGGDDLVAILPGEVAVPFARDLLRELQKRADGHPGLEHSSFHELKPIGAAAGVAIGKQTFPIRHLIHEAEELLHSAKELVYKTGVRSALDFAEVADGSPRRESATPERLLATSPNLLSSARPYSLEELEEFSRRFNIVRKGKEDLGKSQLYLLRRYARDGRAQLRNYVLYQLGRRAGWRQLVTELAGDAAVMGDPDRAMEQIAPTYGSTENGGTHRVFDVADMIELYDHWRDSREVAP